MIFVQTVAYRDTELSSVNHDCIAKVDLHTDRQFGITAPIQ